MPKNDHFPVEFSQNEFFVHENAECNISIIPNDPAEIDRTVTLRPGAKVSGCIFAGSLRIGDECTVSGDIFGDDCIVIGDRTKIQGCVISRGDITIGDGFEVVSHNDQLESVMGSNIYMGEKSVVHGNMIAIGDITVGKNSVVKGFIISLSGDISLEDNVRCHDVLTRGIMYLGDGVKITDNVVWATQGLNYGVLSMAGSDPNRIHKKYKQAYELNLNTDRTEIHLSRHDSFSVDRDIFLSLRGIIPNFDTDKLISMEGRPRHLQEDFERPSYDLEFSEDIEEEHDEISVEHETPPPIPGKKPEKQKAIEEMQRVMRISYSAVEALYEHGYQSVDDLKGVTQEELLEVKGIGLALSEIIIESLR